MERRLRIAPFKYKPKQADRGLKERLKAEYPAILRWIITGCLLWQQHGLGTSPAVAAETGSYFEQQDHFGRWLTERCLTGAGAGSERPSKLLADFLAWAKDSGEASVTSGEFRELVERTPSLRYVRIDDLQWVRNIGLKPPDGYRDRYKENDP